MKWLLEAIPDIFVLAFIYFRFLFPKWKKMEVNACIWHTVLYLYLCVLIGYTLMPVIIHLPYAFDGVYDNVNFLPFSDWIYGYGSYRRETMYNLLLFIPFGFIAQRVIRKPYRITLLYGMLLSMSIEVSQLLFTTNRVCDITDVINNTIGTLMGILLFILYDNYLK